MLDIRGMEVHFETRRGIARAVNEVDLTLYKGERFGLVGESGSGKTTLILALLRMIKTPGFIAGGSATFDDGTDLIQLSQADVRQARLARVAMVPQGAMNSLNPVMRIGDQLILTMREHGIEGEREQWLKRVEELLDKVGLKPEAARLYPHELSGGMKQRVCIAQAISLNPQLILADEPTSALDVVVQRQIMQTLRQLQHELGATVLLVGHDMGLMAQFAERVGIMYGGKLVEVGTVHDIFHNPQHPYTQLLISSIPSFETKGEFKGIPGVALSLLDPPSGCLFHPRCPQATERCKAEEPRLAEVAPNQLASCLLHEEDEHAPAS
ncbi:MAG: dipeptide/oligopeptide/nickel ABC transporter ATP-binding protein [Gemmatimonadetes bacterium]|nr:dipeptide/oligopeptide/nickel ABC transporter ATP-binding protein [Gemmatimonadota bacterium]